LAEFFGLRAGEEFGLGEESDQGNEGKFEVLSAKGKAVEELR
jgi:hypothetical protein